MFCTVLFGSTRGKEETVLIHFKEQYDLSQFHGNRVELKKVLESFTQAALNKQFPHLLENPDIRSVQVIWITNSLRVTGKAETLNNLIPKDGEGTIRWEREKRVPIFEVRDTGSTSSYILRTPERNQIAWGVSKLRAPEVWAQGIEGQGVLVAMIDSGASIEHPDLAPNIWNNPGETGVDSQGNNKANNQIDDDNNGYIDDVYGWDFEANSNKVTDLSGHGTQSAGVVAGKGIEGIKTGVAPKAHMMILKACCSLEGETSEFAMIEAIQYAIQNGAQIISMSLTIKPMFDPSYAQWRRAGEVEKAAGIVHINSAGNSGGGNEPYNIGAPANNPPAWFPPGLPSSNHLTSVIAIGATDPTDLVQTYSSVGPSSWAEISPYQDFPFDFDKLRGLIKPEVCAPSEVPSTSKDGKNYTNDFGGTSSSTPHVAGLAALLLSVQPRLSPPEVTEVIQMSAIPVGSPKINNQCGTGRVDAVAALAYLKSHFIYFQSPTTRPSHTGGRLHP